MCYVKKIIGGAAQTGIDRCLGENEGNLCGYVFSREAENFSADVSYTLSVGKVRRGGYLRGRKESFCRECWLILLWGEREVFCTVVEIDENFR